MSTLKPVHTNASTAEKDANRPVKSLIVCSTTDSTRNPTKSGLVEEIGMELPLPPQTTLLSIELYMHFKSPLAVMHPDGDTRKYQTARAMTLFQGGGNFFLRTQNTTYRLVFFDENESPGLLERIWQWIDSKYLQR